MCLRSDLNFSGNFISSPKIEIELLGNSTLHQKNKRPGKGFSFSSLGVVPKLMDARALKDLRLSNTNSLFYRSGK